MACHATSEIIARGQWLINEEHSMINDTLLGLVKCHPDLALLDFGKVVIRRNHLTMDKVKIVSGGASGHEPAYAGFVGQGMLTAAIQGEIFQSPSTDLIFQSIKELSRRNIHGVLLIINNKVSDRLSFGLAMEKANNIENVQLKMIIVSDEIRNVCENRGLVGTILVQKIAGAMSEQGFFLDEIYYFCTSILHDIGTATVSFTMPVSPYVKIASSARFLMPNEMELGAGFSGEPGFIKMPMKSAAETARILLDNLFSVDSGSTLTLGENTPIVIVVNNLGSCSKLEEHIFLKEIMTQLQAEHMVIAKVYCGSFMTSLKMAGFTLTIMKLNNPKVLEYLNYPCSAPYWREFSHGELDVSQNLYLNTTFTKEELRPKKRRGPDMGKRRAGIIKTAVNFACEALISCERQLNLMDSEVGDGDTGTNIRTAVSEISGKISDRNFDNPFALFKEMSAILEKYTYGLSSLMYSIMFEAAAQPFADLPENYPVETKLWLESLKSILAAIERHGKPRPGMRTMIDPLHAFVVTFETALFNGEEDMESLRLAVGAAEDSARATKIMTYPDPGAHGVGILMRAIYEAIKTKTALG